MTEAVLTISSKNYSSWSLRGWLLCRMGGLAVREEIVPPDDAAARAELLLLSPSFLVPCLIHEGTKVWDTLAIGEYVAEVAPKAGILPADRAVEGALPGGLGRDAFRLPEPALGAADEPQGPLSRLQGLGRCVGRHRSHRSHLDGMPRRLRRAVALRRSADAGRRHVRAGCDALPHLRRCPLAGVGRLPRPRPVPGSCWSNGPARPARNRTRSTSWTPSSEPTDERPTRRADSRPPLGEIDVEMVRMVRVRRRPEHRGEEGAGATPHRRLEGEGAAVGIGSLLHRHVRAPSKAKPAMSSALAVACSLNFAASPPARWRHS